MNDLKSYLFGLIKQACMFNGVIAELSQEMHNQTNSYATKEYVANLAQGDEELLDSLDDVKTIRAAQACGIGVRAERTFHSGSTPNRKDAYTSVAIPLQLDLAAVKGYIVPSVLGGNNPIYLCELIGLLSEDIELTRFNTHTIRHLWKTGRLNAAVRTAHKNNGPDGNYFLRTYDLKDGDYQGLVTYLVKQGRGWPLNYEHNPAKYDPLDSEEENIVDEFSNDEYLGRQAASWLVHRSPTATVMLAFHRTTILNHLHSCVPRNPELVRTLHRVVHQVSGEANAEEILDFLTSWLSADVGTLLGYADQLRLIKDIKGFELSKINHAAEKITQLLQKVVDHGGSSDDVVTDWVDGCDDVVLKTKVYSAQEAKDLLAVVEPISKTLDDVLLDQIVERVNKKNERALNGGPWYLAAGGIGQQL